MTNVTTTSNTRKQRSRNFVTSFGCFTTEKTFPFNPKQTYFKCVKCNERPMKDEGQSIISKQFLKTNFLICLNQNKRSSQITFLLLTLPMITETFAEKLDMGSGV